MIDVIHRVHGANPCANSDLLKAPLCRAACSTSRGEAAEARNLAGGGTTLCSASSGNFGSALEMHSWVTDGHSA
eukprot:1172918-Amphidinium_carterae.1